MSEWVRKSKYHWQYGEHQITACLVGDKYRFSAWRSGELLGVFDDANSARGECENNA